MSKRPRKQRAAWRNVVRRCALMVRAWFRGGWGPGKPYWLLRRADQEVVAVLVVISLATMVGWYTVQGGWQGRLVEWDHAEPLSVGFQVDVNRATWPELAQLPGIGETLARRIVDLREREGPFVAHEDLRRVRGIGAKTLENIRPYLCPLRQDDSGGP